MESRIGTHRNLVVYQNARTAAQRLLTICLKLPAWERRAKEQALACARSILANIAEAWRKRRYRAAWVSKLSDCEAEAAEAQAWLDVFLDAGYITKQEHAAMDESYDHILAQIVTMIADPDKWSGQKIQSRTR